MTSCQAGCSIEAAPGEKSSAVKALLLALALLVSFASLGDAACDPTTISGVSYDTDADSMVTMDQYGRIAWKEGFDYHAGRFFARCMSGGYAGPEFMDVRGSDSYHIQGAPAGVPIPLHVELQIDATIGGTDLFSSCGFCNSHFSGFSASMYDSKGDADSISVCLCWHETRTITLDLSVMPDEEFSIRYGVRANAGIDSMDDGDLEALIRFGGLPPSAELVSCHGVNDAAVPTKPTSWGSLKASYR